MPASEAAAKRQIGRFSEWPQFPESESGIRELVRAFVEACRDDVHAEATGNQLMRTVRFCPKPAEVYQAAEAVEPEPTDLEPEDWTSLRQPGDEPFNGIPDLIDDRIREVLERKAVHGATHAEREKCSQFLRMRQTAGGGQ